MFALTLLITIFASFASIQGADHFGIQAYEGARLDTEETNFLRKIGGADGYCYRTGDDVKKVTAFYQKHPGLTSLGTNGTGGMFVKALVTAADIGSVKKNQTCAPLPDRDLSIAIGMSMDRQVSRNAWTSSIHDSLSKSAAKNQHVSFPSIG
jgi:hypothetical protein